MGKHNMLTQERLDARSTYEPNSGCLIWLGGAKGRYGCITIKGKSRATHRVAYELARGPIPTELELDHICRTPFCINPNHLEAVTHRENVLRGISFSSSEAAQTRCIHGHEFTEENMYFYIPRNMRICKICHLARCRKYRAKKEETDNESA